MFREALYSIYAQTLVCRCTTLAQVNANRLAFTSAVNAEKFGGEICSSLKVCITLVCL